MTNTGMTYRSVAQSRGGGSPANPNRVRLDKDELIQTVTNNYYCLASFHDVQVGVNHLPALSSESMECFLLVGIVDI